MGTADWPADQPRPPWLPSVCPASDPFWLRSPVLGNRLRNRNGYGWRPMKAISLVCSSASSGTGTRGP